MDNTQSHNQETKYLRPPLISPIALIKESWTVFSKHFLDFVEMYLWGLVGSIPLFIIVLIAYGFNNFFVSLLDSYTWLLIIAILLFVSAALWAIYYGIRAHIGIWLLLIHPELKPKEAFQKSVSFIKSYIIVSFVVGILLFLLFLALIIPGLIFYCYWAFATMLVMVENIKTPKAAMKRSKQLVKGYWWPAAGRFILIALIYALFVGLISLPLSYLSDSGKEIYNFLVNMLSTLTTPFLLIYSYKLYQSLAEKK